MKRTPSSKRKATLKRRVVRVLAAELENVRGGLGVIDDEGAPVADAPQSAGDDHCQLHSLRIGGDRRNHNQLLRR